MVGGGSALVAYRYYDFIGVLTILTGLALIVSQYMMDKVYTVEFFIGIVILILGTLLLMLNLRERRKEAEEKRALDNPPPGPEAPPTQPPRTGGPPPPSPRKPR